MLIIKVSLNYGSGWTNTQINKPNNKCIEINNWFVYGVAFGNNHDDDDDELRFSSKSVTFSLCNSQSTESIHYLRLFDTSFYASLESYYLLVSMFHYYHYHHYYYWWIKYQVAAHRLEKETVISSQKKEKKKEKKTIWLKLF